MRPQESADGEPSMHPPPRVLSSRFFIPPEVVDGTGLGGWCLSLNDPVYFEKELIRGRGFSQKPLNAVFARARAAFVMNRAGTQSRIVLSRPSACPRKTCPVLRFHKAFFVGFFISCALTCGSCFCCMEPTFHCALCCIQLCVCVCVEKLSFSHLIFWYRIKKKKVTAL